MKSPFVVEEHFVYSQAQDNTGTKYSSHIINAFPLSHTMNQLFEPLSTITIQAIEKHFVHETNNIINACPNAIQRRKI